MPVAKASSQISPGDRDGSGAGRPERAFQSPVATSTTRTIARRISPARPGTLSRPANGCPGSRRARYSKNLPAVSGYRVRERLDVAVLPLVEEARDPGQVQHDDRNVREQECAPAVAVHPERPACLGREHEDGGVVAVDRQGHGDRVHGPPAPAAPVEREEQRQRGQRDEEHHRRVGPRLGRVEDGERAERDQGGGEQPGAAPHRPPPEQIGQRDERGSEDQRRHAHPDGRVPDLCREPGEHIVERGRDRAVVDIREHATQAVAGDDPVRVAARRRRGPRSGAPLAGRGPPG